MRKVALRTQNRFEPTFIEVGAKNQKEEKRAGFVQLEFKITHLTTTAAHSYTWRTFWPFF